MQSSRPYARRSAWIQWLCPAPKRHLQALILKYGLKSGLDIGCGGGSPLTSLRSNNFRSTGIDIHPGSVERARANQIHDEYLVGDFMTSKIDHSYDVVVLSHVIEHFDRETGLKVLKRLEEVSRCIVYVETPHGFLEQTDYDGNPFQRHLSGWFTQDFEGRGYTVFGSGPRWLRKPMGSRSLWPNPLRRNIPRLMQWYYFRHPQRASTLAAIRFKDEAGNLRAL